MSLNLFRIFEPTTSFLLIKVNLFMILVFIINLLNKRTINFKIKTIITVSSNINKEKIKTQIIITALITTIIFINITGLLPYVLCITSHIVLNLPLSLNIWATIMLFYFSHKTKHILAHLTPLGAPIILSPFLVLIESIRLLIQPLTLALRLTANIIAGHIIISLVIIAINKLNTRIITINLTFSLPLILLEFIVPLIQTYVFIILISLYIRDK